MVVLDLSRLGGASSGLARFRLSSRWMVPSGMGVDLVKAWAHASDWND